MVHKRAEGWSIELGSQGFLLVVAGKSIEGKEIPSDGC